MEAMLHVVQNFKMLFVNVERDVRMFSMRNLKIIMKPRLRIRSFNVRIRSFTA